MSAAGSVVARDDNGKDFLEWGDRKDGSRGYYKVLVGTRSVRLRMVNRNLVIPEQVNDISKAF